MEPGTKNLSSPTDKRITTPDAAKSSADAQTKEEMDARLLLLLGEVIRMSQAWVRALESGDPFTADKYDAECVRAIERFEAHRNKTRSQSKSVEQTQ
jgi:hypothetical protein